MTEEHTEKDSIVITSLETLKDYIDSKDNAISNIYFSAIPEICKTEKCILGVDEAGRGPVLGPMVYGIAFCPVSKQKLLKDLGCADSKQLTEDQRDEIFINANQKDYSSECTGWAVDIISPSEISTSMFRRVKRSLNEVSMESAISLIKKAIELEVNVAEVYVDTVGPPEKYQAKLQLIFPKIKITVAKKADSTYPIVSLASICAKVSRDHALKVWKFREGIEVPEDGFGSGYPGDPVTKRFLHTCEPVFGYPRIVRFSWSTAVNALNGPAYAVEFEEEEEPEKATFSSKKMTSFFKAEVPVKKFKRSQFWKDRCLEDVVEF
jgi:ribonuclease H2 subunit A